MQSRREFIALSAAFSLMPLAGAGATTQVAGIYRRGVGDIIVTALLDGYLSIDPGMLVGTDAETNAALLRDAFLGDGPVPTSVNAYVVESGGRTIMVDGGAGAAFGPTAGNIASLLDAAGVDRAAVDTVFTTHLHPDHIGALAGDTGATFTNAELVMHTAEHGFWTNEDNFAGAPEQVQGFAAAAQGVATAYGDRLKLISDGAEIAPGVTAMELAGHTPGHTGLMLSSGDATLLLWGDIVHVGPIQFARPSVTIPFDVDQDAAAATRARVLDMVTTDRLEIAGSHVDFPSFGHVVGAADGYGFVPGRWDHEL